MVGASKKPRPQGRHKLDLALSVLPPKILPLRVLRSKMGPKWLVVILIVLDLGASTWFGFEGDWRRGLYWLAAAVLSYVVTF